VVTVGLNDVPGVIFVAWIRKKRYDLREKTANKRANVVIRENLANKVRIFWFRGWGQIKKSVLIRRIRQIKRECFLIQRIKRIKKERRDLR
jgi:hypothetical protein